MAVMIHHKGLWWEGLKGTRQSRLWLGIFGNTKDMSWKGILARATFEAVTRFPGESFNSIYAQTTHTSRIPIT